MKNRIAIIDSMSSQGHQGFNEILLNCFTKREANVTFIGRSGYLNSFCSVHSISIIEVPDILFWDTSSSALWRLNQLVILNYIIMHVDLDKFDYIVFSCFDEIVLSLCDIRSKKFLIVHGNVRTWEGALKKILVKYLENNSTYVVFTKEIALYLRILGIKKVLVEPHGLRKAFVPQVCDENFILNNLLKSIPRKGLNRIFFIPDLSKLGNRDCEESILTPQFDQFLRKHNIYIIIKSATHMVSYSNIIGLSRRLNDREYELLLLFAFGVILYYPHKFSLTVSGVLMECISNNKIVLLTQIESFKIFKNHFRYNPFFRNVEELESLLLSTLRLEDKIISDPYDMPNLLEPSYSGIIRGLNGRGAKKDAI